MTIYVVFAPEDYTFGKRKGHGIYLYGVFTDKSEAKRLMHEKDSFIHECTLDECKKELLCGFSESPHDDDDDDE